MSKVPRWHSGSENDLRLNREENPRKSFKFTNSVPRPCKSGPLHCIALHCTRPFKLLSFHFRSIVVFALARGSASNCAAIQRLSSFHLAFSSQPKPKLPNPSPTRQRRIASHRIASYHSYSVCIVPFVQCVHRTIRTVCATTVHCIAIWSDTVLQGPLVSTLRTAVRVHMHSTSLSI